LVFIVCPQCQDEAVIEIIPKWVAVTHRVSAEAAITLEAVNQEAVNYLVVIINIDPPPLKENAVNYLVVIIIHPPPLKERMTANTFPPCFKGCLPLEKNDDNPDEH
jgi:hypothetical protein